MLEWDTGDFRKTIESIKQSKEKPSESHLAAIDEHLQASREQHAAIRELSKREEKSIIIALLDAKDKDLAVSLTEAQHTQCMEYYSAQLAIRDREKITEALCRQSPDLTTSIVRDGVSVFEPMIRAIHKNVDLRKHISSVESFLTDLIATSKPKKHDDGQKQNGAMPPSVEDYVALLRRNRRLGYEYLHDFAEGCPDLRKTWLDWVKNSLAVFRQIPETNGSIPAKTVNASSYGAAKMDKDLQSLFDNLPDEKKSNVKDAIDAHAMYLSTLGNVSITQTQSIIDRVDELEKGRTGGSMSGPGVYITRWHCLLDETIVTPNTPRGPPRRGKEVKSLKALGKTEAIADSETWDPDALEEEKGHARPDAPDVSAVVDALRSQFRELVADISSKGIPQH